MDSLLKNAACVIPQPKTKQLLPLFWLTESRLLVQERRPTGSPPQVRTGILDIPSGKTTYPASVPRYLQGSLSPNKKWVLCEPPTQWDYEGVLWVEAVSLNGQPTQRWTYEKPELGFQVFKTSNFFWLPDGRSWVLLAYASTNKGNLIYALTGNWTEKPYIKVFPLGLSQDDISPSTNTQSAYLHWELRLSQGERSQREFPPKGTQLQWLPSGKKLSFQYDNALWVVPDAPPKQPQII
ncbi:MAG: hypothetical protein NTX57_02865 [Armatimonadetes bacterium]|nr:hypothetical protein [Armatimonadota bacterium]